jgi:CheY-like chemotaxis protein
MRGRFRLDQLLARVSIPHCVDGAPPGRNKSLAVATARTYHATDLSDMSAPTFPKRHILVVDDEPLVCDAVKMMLAFDGHAVETACNGKEALALFDREKFDLVITDFSMPAMKGDELATAIKARDPKQPVVMITAFAEMLQSSSTPLRDVDYVISKPFLLENLREAIAKVTAADGPKGPEESKRSRGPGDGGAK